MLGLVVNTYVDANEEAFKVHRVKASTMDLNNLGSARVEASIATEPSSQRLDSDDDKPNFLVDANAIMAALDIHPLLALAPERPQPEPQGTPAAYTGSSAGTTQGVAPARTSGPDVFGTPRGCSTSVSPRPTPAVP